jgi:hypothetical protein
MRPIDKFIHSRSRMSLAIFLMLSITHLIGGFAENSASLALDLQCFQA